MFGLYACRMELLKRLKCCSRFIPCSVLKVGVGANDKPLFKKLISRLCEGK